LTRDFVNTDSAISNLPSAGLVSRVADPPLPAPAPRPCLTIRASRGWVQLDLKELWQFRDLFFSLAGRDLKLRYKQTALGVIWVILQPLMAAGVFSFVFGTVAKLPSAGIPYLVFAYAGLLGWNLFNGILGKTTGCLVGNSHLISKVFFPRLILPLSNIGSSLVDFAVAAGMMGVLLAFHRIVPSPMLLLFPVWMAILIAIAMGFGLITAALTVSYRDVQHMMPVFTQILLYASPVAYSFTAVPGHQRWVYLLNPITPPLEAMRSSLLGTAFPGWLPLLLSASFAGLFLLAGLYSFKRMERMFADVI
jgi:lipopolysaccharide transport system permease protein